MDLNSRETTQVIRSPKIVATTATWLFAQLKNYVIFLWIFPCGIQRSLDKKVIWMQNLLKLLEYLAVYLYKLGKNQQQKI